MQTPVPPIAPASTPRSVNRRAGRPTAAKAAEIDRIILATAREVFMTDGVDGASMDAVAAAAKVSKGTLYSRYASKDALLLAVITELIQDLDRTASSTNYLLPVELKPRLHEYSRRLVEHMAQPEYIQLNRLITSTSRLHPEIARHGTDVALADYIRTLSTQMQKAARHSRPESVDWQGLAQLLVHGITGWHRSAVSAGAFSEAAFDAYRTTVVDAIVALIDSK